MENMFRDQRKLSLKYTEEQVVYLLGTRDKIKKDQGNM